MFVVLLALPVVGMVGGGLTAWSTAYLVGFAVFLVLLSGVVVKETHDFFEKRRKGELP